MFVLLFACSRLDAQIEIAKLIGKNSSDYKLGYGAFLQFAFPVTETSDITAEAGLLFWFLKDDSGDGMAVFPAKAGYRYCINGRGTGIYVQPQVGYTIYGVQSNTKFNGFTWSAGAGYLFEPSGRIQFDLGIRYESIVFQGSSVNYIGLRLSHNFSLGKRNAD